MSDPRKFYTSDTHFGHANIIKFCNRPFKSADEMDEEMIYRWNNVVRPGDVVFHLGDFGFYPEEKDTRSIIRRLNGNKFLIWGNHDKQFRSNQSLQKMFAKCGAYYEVMDGNQHMVLCHYAMRVWNKSHYDTIMLYGHSHGTLPGDSQSLDVGVDCWDFAPITLEQIKRQLVQNPKRPKEFGD